MKILMVNKYLYPKGGAETYFLKLGEYLQEMGENVQYFGMDNEKRVVGNDIECYTKAMDFHDKSWNKITYPFKIVYSFEARRKIRRVLNAFKPDIVHLNNFNFQLTPSIIYAIKQYKKETKENIKIVFTAHDYQLVCPNHLMNNPITHCNCEQCREGKFYYCIKGRCIHKSILRSLLGAIEGALYYRLHTYRYIDKIICPSHFIEGKITENPDLSGKTVVMHNFIENHRSKEIQNKNYVLYFGRYSDEKGIGTLLKVCKELSDIPFVFAGSGPLEDEINKVKNVHNIGFLQGGELESVIANASFSIYPSEWYENCPFSVMESQMYGTPVIASNIGGIPELLKNGVTGYLFESGNEIQLSTTVKGLWENKEKIRELSQNCLQIQYSTIDEYYKKLKQIYCS